MKKSATLYHSLVYCLKVAVLPLLFTLVACYCLAGEKTSIVQTKYDKLVIYASSQEELNAKIVEHTDATSAHLILDHKVNFELSSVTKLKQLTTLTIEYPIYSEIGVSGDGGMFNAPLDLSFLNKVRELRYLVIDWSGLVMNESAIGNLPNLLYARIPYDAFSPSLFSLSNLQQLELRDHGIFIVLKSSNKLELTRSGYETQFDNTSKSFKKFDTRVRKNAKSQTIWPNQLLQLNDSGDTILSITGIHSDQFKWVMKNSKTQEVIKGKMVLHEIPQIERTVSNTLFYRSVEINQNHKRIVWTDKIKGTDLVNYKEENYTISGLKDGLFLQKSGNRIVFEEHYQSSELVYQFPYTGKIPSIPQQNYLENFSTTPKEAFFENAELVILRTKQPEKAGNFLVITVPLNRSKIEGLFTVLTDQSDTLLSATYSDGKLNGSYYYYSMSVDDTIKVYGNYRNGKPIGLRKVLRKHTSTISNYDDGFLTKLIHIKNENNQLMQEVIWDAKNKSYKEKIWGSDGLLVIERVLDANMKVINEKK